jgi:hypothetical protein
VCWSRSVRSDCRYSESVRTDLLVEFLDSVSDLRCTDHPAYYQGKGELGWLRVLIVACDSAGNYAVREGEVPQRVNMVELICCSGDGTKVYEPQAVEAATAMATRIADQLGWEIVDDETGEVLHTGPAG